MYKENKEILTDVIYKGITFMRFTFFQMPGKKYTFQNYYYCRKNIGLYAQGFKHEH